MTVTIDLGVVLHVVSIGVNLLAAAGLGVCAVTNVGHEASTVIVPGGLALLFALAALHMMGLGA